MMMMMMIWQLWWRDDDDDDNYHDEGEDRQTNRIEGRTQPGKAITWKWIYNLKRKKLIQKVKDNVKEDSYGHTESEHRLIQNQKLKGADKDEK